MSIVLSGWPTHVLEAACSLLCYFSTEKRIDPSGAAGQGSAELKSSEVDFPPPWLPLLTQDWSLDSHFSLILLLDYLDVPVAVPPMLVWLAKLASERSLSSTEPVLPVLSRLPPHLLTLFIENLHPDVWFDFRCRGDATSLFSSASGEFALWVHWYLAFLRTRLEFSRREDVFRTYGKSSSRDLTELPPQLQVRAVPLPKCC